MHHPATAQPDETLKAKYVKKKLEVRQLKRELECVEGMCARLLEPSRPQLYSNETEVQPALNVSGDSSHIQCTLATSEAVERELNDLQHKLSDALLMVLG